TIALVVGLVAGGGATVGVLSRHAVVARSIEQVAPEVSAKTLPIAPTMESLQAPSPAESSAPTSAAEPEPAAPPKATASASPVATSVASPRFAEHPASSGVAAAPSAPSGDPGAEVRLLQQAQDALASDPARAFALAGTHARTFSAPLLSQEREVIA